MLTYAYLNITTPQHNNIFTTSQHNTSTSYLTISTSQHNNIFTTSQHNTSTSYLNT
ncbi:MAG: hypothetical protein ACI3YV_09440 [Prevotella sp.]